uniref:Corticotropin-releasing factor domain-containing protein n=1 Tax=Clastoptera arizonana TaxID=38151 RepID=A0A1B6E378_9HEMI
MLVSLLLAIIMCTGHLCLTLQSNSGVHYMPEDEPGQIADWIPDREFNQVESKRSQSLSIVNPLEVLRQKLMLDVARRRLRGQEDANREWLKSIGKRSESNQV